MAEENEQPDFYGLKVRKWTRAERDHVIALRQELNYGPKKLSTLTGIPQGQIKFWLYSESWGKSYQKRKAEGKLKDGDGPAASARAYYRTKFQDWESWKSHTLRSSLIKTCKLTPSAGVAPARKDIEDWLRTIEMVCVYCRLPLTTKNFSVDHRQPTCRGGKSDFENMSPCCRRCNTAKGVLNEVEFGQLLGLVAGWEDMSRRSLMARLGRGFVGRRF